MKPLAYRNVVSHNISSTWHTLHVQSNSETLSD